MKENIACCVSLNFIVGKRNMTKKEGEKEGEGEKMKRKNEEREKFNFP